jgi:hypothetical protein
MDHDLEGYFKAAREVIKAFKYGCKSLKIKDGREFEAYREYYSILFNECQLKCPKQ